ncbi:hypothetical protein HKX48_006798 [Thoreauomyces humboldtii]|nr:hypothetical protein HKX48_006798 [Thoreauomyces humboldtii]
MSLNLWPVVAMNVVGLTLNTYTIQMGDASFYQIARGLVLPLTVALSWMYLDRPSAKVLGACGLVTGSYLLGTLGDSVSVHISTGAILFGALSSVTTAGHAIVIKQAMGSGGNTIDLVYYNNLLSAIFFPIVMLVTGEARTCQTYVARMLDADSAAGLDYNDAKTFVVGCLLTGTLGFLLNVASFFLIKVTSPVTHVVSSAARGVYVCIAENEYERYTMNIVAHFSCCLGHPAFNSLQTVVAVILFNDTVTTVRAGSLVGITLGSGLYTWIKHLETQKPAELPFKQLRFPQAAWVIKSVTAD